MVSCDAGTESAFPNVAANQRVALALAFVLRASALSPAAVPVAHAANFAWMTRNTLIRCENG